MKTITLHEVSDSLLYKLEKRAAANHRTLEAEALMCLQVVVETEEGLIESIPTQRWADIERSVCETIHDKGTPLSEADFERYRGMIRGGSNS